MPRILPQELSYWFTTILEQRLRTLKVKNVHSAIADIVPQMMDKVPSEAYEPVNSTHAGHILFHGETSEENMKARQQELMDVHLTLPSKKPIYMYMTSPGGEVDAGLGLVSTIQGIQREGRPVNIHVQGGAYSMGAIILQAATKRTCEPYSFFLLHAFHYGSEEHRLDHHEDYIDYVKRQDQACDELFAARTGKPWTYFRKKYDRRHWFLSAQEALDENLVDEVSSPVVYKRFRRRHS